MQFAKGSDGDGGDGGDSDGTHLVQQRKENLRTYRCSACSYICIYWLLALVVANSDGGGLSLWKLASQWKTLMSGDCGVALQ
ncbi:unnamed protein product, partial [Ceratitis capitata]